MAKSNAERQARFQTIARLKVEFFQNVESRKAGARGAGVDISGSRGADIVLEEYHATQDRIHQLRIEWKQDDELF